MKSIKYYKIEVENARIGCVNPLYKNKLHLFTWEQHLGHD
jgi:hypothetical protein